MGPPGLDGSPGRPGVNGEENCSLIIPRKKFNKQ